MWDSSSSHILIVLLILVKEVRGINTHTNSTLQITRSGKNTVLINDIDNMHTMPNDSFSHLVTSPGPTFGLVLC